MNDQERLLHLIQQYEEIKMQFLNAVESASAKSELDFLKRRLETIASQIRKINVNYRL